MRRDRKAKRRRERGFSFIEIMLGGAILALGILSHASLTVTNLSQTSFNDTRRHALAAAEDKLEEIRGHAFGSVFSHYGSGASASFDVEGLEPATGDKDGRVGAIRFPTIGGALREDVHDRCLGMPRDLDHDGVIDASTKNTSYACLPVLVEVRWRSSGGDQRLQLAAVLTAGD